ncbi:MAG: hypothetical protein KF757_02820 [Phycisphaeraceae bacterium]|nr:hypothetical protein [Phycisphaeraceae bacterium]MCW5764304.1 hypothetical protein [Phycisphaeraceae bacterium]
MVDDFSQLMQLLNGGQLVEHRYPNVELKQNWSQDVGKDLSGQANARMSDSAFIVIGVNDTGEVVGPSDNWAKETEHRMASHIGQYLDPPQACTSIQAVSCKGRWVVVASVSCPGVVTKWNDSAYRVIGTTTKRLTSEDVMHISLEMPGLHDYSAQPWSGDINDGVASLFLKKFISHNDDMDHLASLTPSQALQSLRIADTNVSRILFGPTKFRVVKYNQDGDPIENRSREPLGLLLLPDFRHEIQLYTQEILGVADKIYNDEALHESFANAVAHAHYFDSGGDILVEVYKDRVIISNLCAAGAAALANRWLSSEHYTYNRSLVEFLRLCEFVEELGRGKRVIYRESIKYGHLPPNVKIGRAGKNNRWSLSIFGGFADEKLVKLLTRLRDYYKDEQRAIVGLSLVLWRDKPVGELREFFGPEYNDLLLELLSDMRGATWYRAEDDRVYLSRWAQLILDEGVDSKRLSSAEEEQLFEFAASMARTFNKGFITNCDLRTWASIGDAPSAKTQASLLLKKWVQNGSLQRTNRSTYLFVGQPRDDDVKRRLSEILSAPRATPSPE